MKNRSQIPVQDLGFRPSTQLDLILSLDLLREIIDVRRSIVYEQQPDCLIVAQTDPPLESDRVGEEIEVTYLQTPVAGGAPSRWGYVSRIQEIKGAYRLSGWNQTAQAIVLSSPKETLEEVNIRLFYRYCSARVGGVGIQLSCMDDYIDLLNLSFGGCLVAVPKPFDSHLGRKLEVVLDLDEEGKMVAKAEIRHAAEHSNGRDIITGLRFLNIAIADSRRLQRKLNQLIGLERSVKPEKK